jgi:hypothetical protein
MDRPQVFLFVVRALPSDVPVANRLRAALKNMLRAHGLRCLRLEDITEDAADDDPPRPRRPLAGGLGPAEPPGRPSGR